MQNPNINDMNIERAQFYFSFIYLFLFLFYFFAEQPQKEANDHTNMI